MTPWPKFKVMSFATAHVSAGMLSRRLHLGTILWITGFVAVLLLSSHDTQDLFCIHGESRPKMFFFWSSSRVIIVALAIYNL